MIAETTTKFRYDPIKHEYWLGDQRLPHPTGPAPDGVLYPWTNFDAVPKDVLESARNFGSSVHEYVAAYNRGELDMTAELPKEDNYDMAAIIGGYDEIYGENVLFPHTIEKPLLHKELRYGCTPDFISGNTVYDLKPISQKKKKTVGIQLAANAGAAISNGLIDKDKVELASLHYDSWGKWELIKWPFKEFWNYWMCALTLHNAKIGG